jgi:multiple sugar transport system permease protein
MQAAGLNIVGNHGRKTVVTTAMLAMVLLYAIAPICYLFIAATKTENDLFTTFGFWFAKMNLVENIGMVFRYHDGIFLRWLFNSFWYSAASALSATALSAMAGYALAMFRFPLKETMFRAVLCAVAVPQTALVIPIFLLMTRAGIVDTPAAVILPSMIFPLGVYLMRIYVEDGVPRELLEAARVDGAGELRIFLSIACRLMTPGFVTVLLLSFVSAWNNYFLPQVVLTSPEKLSLTVGLSSLYLLANNTATGEPLFSVVIVGAFLSVLPIVLAFLLLQRYWQAGVTAGAVK